MKRWLWILLAAPAWCESRLDQLLERQRGVYPQAVVTSGFYDARAISRYRSRPGMHSGYDIAMPAGALARAAWPGRVSAIIPWAQGEWGVEVLHQDGTSATYGHIIPTVSVGQQLTPGEGVGTVARDHLDVKMRDGQGLLFDYGSTRALAEGQALPVVMTPSELALEFQRRLRAMKEEKLMQPGPWETLKAKGLRVGRARIVSDLPALETLRAKISETDRKRLRWDSEDRVRAQSWRRRLEALKTRYELGFVSLRQLQEAERRVRLWEVAEGKT